MYASRVILSEFKLISCYFNMYVTSCMLVLLNSWTPPCSHYLQLGRTLKNPWNVYMYHLKLVRISRLVCGSAWCQPATLSEFDTFRVAPLNKSGPLSVEVFVSDFFVMASGRVTQTTSRDGDTRCGYHCPLCLLCLSYPVSSLLPQLTPIHTKLLVVGVWHLCHFSVWSWS